MKYTSSHIIIPGSEFTSMKITSTFPSENIRTNASIRHNPSILENDRGFFNCIRISSEILFCVHPDSSRIGSVIFCPFSCKKFFFQWQDIAFRKCFRRFKHFITSFAFVSQVRSIPPGDFQKVSGTFFRSILQWDIVAFWKFFFIFRWRICASAAISSSCWRNIKSEKAISSSSLQDLFDCAVVIHHQQVLQMKGNEKRWRIFLQTHFLSRFQSAIFTKSMFCKWKIRKSCKISFVSVFVDGNFEESTRAM